LFNFRSLAAVVGVTLEGENAGRRLSRIRVERLPHDEAGAAAAGDSPLFDSAKADEADIYAGVERGLEQGTAVPTNIKSQPDDSRSASPESGRVSLPEVTITQETPTPNDDIDDEAKPLGYETRMVERPNQVTQ
jgi:hypothetical protein